MELSRSDSDNSVDMEKVDGRVNGTQTASECGDVTDLSNEGAIQDEKRGEFLFYVQAIVLIIVVIACIINLSLQNGDQTAWAAMLSGCLGLLLPQPQRINFKIK
jgi:hypothetical protein